MKPNTYNPKELLNSLLEIEEKLLRTLTLNCPDQRIYISEDIDKAMEDFLQLRDDKEDALGFHPSHLALLYLCRETEKTIDIVVEANNLKAYRDYGKYQETLNVANPKNERTMHKWRDWFLLVLGTLFGGACTFFWLS